MTQKNKNIVGIGIGMYSLSEAAFFARIPAATLNRWLYGNSLGKQAIRPQLVLTDNRTVTFLDLVQAVAIQNIRIQYKISLQKIREAVNVAKENYNIDYPFARQHKTFLCGKDIIIELDDSEHPVQISGRDKGQVVMKRILEEYLKDLSYDPNGLANAYRPYHFHDASILISPQKRFGEPLVESCSIPAQIIIDTVKTEGSINAAAYVHGISDEEVELAVKYFDYLEGISAA